MRLLRLDYLPYFNSKVVRLKDGVKIGEAFTYKNFNSKVVRLKVFTPL